MHCIILYYIILYLLYYIISYYIILYHIIFSLSKNSSKVTLESLQAKRITLHEYSSFSYSNCYHETSKLKERDSSEIPHKFLLHCAIKVHQLKRVGQKILSISVHLAVGFKSMQEK